MRDAPPVFVSYSHADGVTWRDHVEKLWLKTFVEAGLLRSWSDDNIEIGSRWHDEIQEAIRGAECALLLITPGFLESDYVRDHEMKVFEEKLRGNSPFAVVPVLCIDCEYGNAYPWLADHEIANKSMPISQEPQSERALLASLIRRDVIKKLSDIAIRRTARRRTENPSTQGNFPLSHRSEDSSHPFVGREQEVAILKLANESETIRVVALVSSGGSGKSTVVREWISNVDENSLRRFRHVFTWSFYSQGSSASKPIAIEPFLNSALAALKITGAEEVSAMDKAGLIVDKLCNEPCLVILDGLEPLQHSLALPQLSGKFREPVIEEILRAMTDTALHPQCKSLCVVTTRMKLVELRDVRRSATKSDAPYVEIEMEDLNDIDGARLLYELGVIRNGNLPLNDTSPELRKASRDVGGHALTLSLLGRYLSKAETGDLMRANKISFLEQDRQIREGATRRMLDRFADWFGHDQNLALGILRILGLFDRPAEASLLKVLRTHRPIIGLTDAFFVKSGALEQACGPETWNFSLWLLSQFGLITCSNEGEIDCHPLIREHFAEKLQAENRAGWEEGCRALANSLIDRSTGDVVEANESVHMRYRGASYLAMAGCVGEAAQYYHDTISEGHLGSTTRKYGTFSSELAFLANFLDSKGKFANLQSIQAEHSGLIVSQTIFNLLQVGRFEEAEPLAKAMLEDPSLKDADRVVTARNLANYNLGLGRPQVATQFLTKYLDLADHVADEFMPFGYRMSLGYASLLSRGPDEIALGHYSEAWKWFDRWKVKTPPELPSLHYLRYLLAIDDVQGASAYLKLLRSKITSGEWNKGAKAQQMTGFGEAVFHMLTFTCSMHDKMWLDPTNSAPAVEQHVHQSGRRDLRGEWLLLRSELARRTQRTKNDRDPSVSRRLVAQAIHIARTDNRRTLLCEAQIHHAKLHCDMAEYDKAKEAIDLALQLSTANGDTLTMHQMDASLIAKLIDHLSGQNSRENLQLVLEDAAIAAANINYRRCVNGIREIQRNLATGTEIYL